MSDPTLILLANEVRGKTLRLIEPLSEADAQFKPPGLNNSILWNAGHALVVVEHLSVAPLYNAQLSYPQGYFETFSWKSDPSTVKSWPTLAEVRQKLTEQLQKLVAGLEQTDEKRMQEIIDAQRNRTLRWSILHGLHDEAGHQGEIWLLRKMLAKGFRG